MRVLLVGASGQLGGEVFRQLLLTEHSCIALLRRPNEFQYSNSQNQQSFKVIQGDLEDYSSLEKACQNIDVVISTANSIIPKKNEQFGINEIRHYENLLKACQYNQVKHFIFISAFTSPHENNVPEFKIKRQIEKMIIESKLAYTIFRTSAFMDIYFAVFGSKRMIENEKSPTLLRGFWLTNFYAKTIVGIVEKFRIAIIPGNGKIKHSFICIHDVASFLIGAITTSSARFKIIELAGPTALTYQEVINNYSQHFGKKIFSLHLSSFFLKFFALLFRPFSPAGENILSSLHLISKYNHEVDMNSVAKEFNITLMNVDQFLGRKLKK